MIHLGLIGVGGYGRVHLQAILMLQSAGLVKLVGIADRSTDALEQCRTMAGMHEVHRFNDHACLLALPGLTAVVIAAPIPLHYQMTMQALEKDLFVLLEKPPTPFASDLESLIAKDRKKRTMVAFQHTYSELTQLAKEAVLSGKLGRINSYTACGLWPRPTEYYSRAGWAGQLFWDGKPVLDGPCTNAMAHFVHLILFLAGKTYADSAMPSRVSGEVYRARPIPSYDTALVSGEFADGARFCAGFSHSITERLAVSLRIEGTKGSCAIANDGRSVCIGESKIVVTESAGMESLYRAFLAFAAGDASRNITPLSAMRPFVHTTNLMFQSSEGIHSVPDEFTTISAPGTAQSLYSVRELEAILPSAVAAMKSLSEVGVPWAVRPRLLAASQLSEKTIRVALSDTSAFPVIPSKP